MRMTEDFSGCRVLSYCVMSNHFHILLEVPPRPSRGLADEDLLKRLDVFYPGWKVREVAAALEQAREQRNEKEAGSIRERYTYRMLDLSEFKTHIPHFC